MTASRLENRARDRAFRVLLRSAVMIALFVLIIIVVDLATAGVPRLSMDFVTSLDSRFPDSAGLLPALLGTIWLMVLVAAMVLPIGVGTAIWLEEYAGNSRISRIVTVNISNLAAVPSVVYGLLGLVVFVRGMEMGRTVLAGAMTLTLLLLPLVVVSAREALRAVPPSIREAALGVGATRWQVVRHHTLPAALPGILTGMVLGLSRAIGETAPLVALGALTYVTFIPMDPGDRFTALPIQVFSWLSRPQDGFEHAAAAGILLLLGVLVALHAIAYAIRRRSAQP